jgi:hypothetical protein
MHDLSHADVGSEHLRRSDGSLQSNEGAARVGHQIDLLLVKADAQKFRY